MRVAFTFSFFSFLWVTQFSEEGKIRFFMYKYLKYLWILEFNRKKKIHIELTSKICFLIYNIHLLLHLQNLKVKDTKAYQITSIEYKGQSRIDLDNKPTLILGKKHTLFYKVSLVLLSQWISTLDTH